MNKDSIFYKSGDAFLPPTVVGFLNTYIVGNDTSIYYINYWSIVHMISGMLFYIINGNVCTAFIIHTLWETWQLAINMTTPGSRGAIDILNDTLFFMLGFYICKKLKV